MVPGEKSTAEGLIDLMKKRYAEDKTDEFMTPIILSDEGRIKGIRITPLSTLVDIISETILTIKL